MSNLRQVLSLIVAMALAYGLVLAAPLLCDFVFGTRLETCFIVWLNVGLFVIHLKKLPYPPPETDRIDVRGGLVVLWWALFWPRYLRRR